jgi:hypothetical protein
MGVNGRNSERHKMMLKVFNASGVVVMAVDDSKVKIGKVERINRP